MKKNNNSQTNFKDSKGRTMSTTPLNEYEKVLGGSAKYINPERISDPKKRKEHEAKFNN